MFPARPRRERHAGAHPEADRLVLVVYDIGDRRRWRRVFRLLQGHGEWVQLSVFQCRLTPERRRRLEGRLARLIRTDADHILLADLGPAATAEAGISSLGRPWIPIEVQAIVI